MMSPSIDGIRPVRERRHERPLLYVLFAVVVIHAVWALIAGISQPLIDEYSFRQTQTAISAYWLMRGGAWLAYETPVLGAPWAAPFEFPIYQLLSAGLAQIGVPLDMAGRLINFAFFMACLLPLRLLARSMRLSQTAFWFVAILFLSSPLYVYWSRTFMIESCALFFSLLWLACLARYIETRKNLWLIAAIISGCLGVLAKSTTFPAFGLIGGISTAVVLFRSWRGGVPLPKLGATALAFAAIGCVPLVAGFVWVGYSDAVKLANPFGPHLTSAALTTWNFGTLKQRLDGTLWSNALVPRTLPQALGVLWPVTLLIILAGLARRNVALWIAASILGFFTPFLLFTNLYFVHAYYPYAAAIFLAAGAGIALDRIFLAKWRPIGLALLVVLVGSQLYFFHRNYAHFLFDDPNKDDVYRASMIVKASTPPNSSVLVFGVDWSSIVPYLSERKGLAMANWVADPLYGQVLADPQHFLGDRPLGAIVVCDPQLPTDPRRRAALDAFFAGRTVFGSAGRCRVLSPTVSTGATPPKS
ncbi:MAG: phospholipid carrier-dependent glycosyltransferase [Devosia sp.]|nr:phospholipid carrier-dependent glycosyltransferase [Devosia sp.]